MGALLYGLLLGLGAWLIPGALLGWLARAAVLGMRDWLAGLQLTIPLPLTEGITLDLASALSLSDAQARLTALSGQELTLVLAVALGTAAAGMLLTGLTAFLGAVFYNLFASVFGGLEVRLDALDAPTRLVPQGAPVLTRGTSTVQSTPANPQQPAVAPRPAPPQVARPTVTAWLAAANGGERRALRAEVTRIGSAPENDIVLPGLAPQHAEIRRESGRYLIYDLGSRRTWVNDAQVAAVHMLKDGFRLQLGQSEFIVHLPANIQAIAEG
jgi:hypothetical protein